MDIIITFNDCSQTALSLISLPVGPGGKLHGAHGVVYAVAGFLVEAAVSLDQIRCHNSARNALSAMSSRSF